MIDLRIKYFNSSSSTASDWCVDLEFLYNTQYWKKGFILGKGGFGEVRLYTHIGTAFNVVAKQVTFDPSDETAKKEMEALKNEINHLQIISKKIINF